MAAGDTSVGSTPYWRTGERHCAWVSDRVTRTGPVHNPREAAAVDPHKAFGTVAQNVRRTPIPTPEASLGLGKLGRSGCRLIRQTSQDPDYSKYHYNEYYFPSGFYGVNSLL